METNEWTIEMKRTCTVCKGTGRYPQEPDRGPGQTVTRMSPLPYECESCNGTKEERRPVTLEELRNALSELGPRANDGRPSS